MKSKNIKSGYKYKPMLLKTAKPFDSEDWIFEIKFDGFRVLAYVENSKTTLITRNGNNITANYPNLQITTAKTNCILDGELIALTNGKPDFNKLKQGKGNTQFVIFDILNLNGEDLTQKKLTERKKILKDTIIETEHIVISRYISTHGIALFKLAKRERLEGIVAKRKASPYQPGKRSTDWLKIKHLSHAEYLEQGRGFNKL